MRRQPEDDDAVLEGTDGGQPTVLQEEVNPLRRHRNACRQEGWEQLHKGRIHTLIILRIKNLIIFDLKLLMDLIIHVGNAMQRQTFATLLLRLPLSWCRSYYLTMGIFGIIIVIPIIIVV